MAFVRRAIVLLVAVAFGAQAEDKAGNELSAWTPGTLEIHQISTGRGNAGLYIFPDGTTLLVDAGEVGRKAPNYSPDHPDGSRTAGEWVVRYVKHALRHMPEPRLDYVLLTHFHGDHAGEVSAVSKPSASGTHKLTGLAQVGEDLKIGKLIDRGFPSYDYPAEFTDAATLNYLAFAKDQRERKGVKMERFVAGSRTQFALLRDAARYPDFEFRNIGVNGEIWTGVGDNTRHHFPDLAATPRADWPSENMCGTSFRISYGKFDYFNGADIPGIPAPGYPLWHDVETPVAKAVGPVDAAILNHHGYMDSMNEFFIATLRPRVWTVPVWGAGHLNVTGWSRMQSTRLYPGPRSVYATDLHEATRTMIGGEAKLAAAHGHIVVRVSPGGAEYRVIVVDDNNESHKVVKVDGPFPSR